MRHSISTQLRLLILCWLPSRQPLSQDQEARAGQGWAACHALSGSLFMQLSTLTNLLQEYQF